LPLASNGRLRPSTVLTLKGEKREKRKKKKRRRGKKTEQGPRSHPHTFNDTDPSITFPFPVHRGRKKGGEKKGKKKDGQRAGGYIAFEAWRQFARFIFTAVLFVRKKRKKKGKKGREGEGGKEERKILPEKGDSENGRPEPSFKRDLRAKLTAGGKKKKRRKEKKGKSARRYFSHCFIISLTPLHISFLWKKREKKGKRRRKGREKKEGETQRLEVRFKMCRNEKGKERGEEEGGKEGRREKNGKIAQAPARSKSPLLEVRVSVYPARKEKKRKRRGRKEKGKKEGGEKKGRKRKARGRGEKLVTFNVQHLT